MLTPLSPVNRHSPGRRRIAALVAMIVLAAGLAPAEPGPQATDALTAPAPPVQRISVLQAAVLGVVEGLTEYLPVSSTGHLILTSHAMGLSRFEDQRGPLGRRLAKGEAVSAFEIVIQLGAVLAVLGLYRKRVWQMCLGLVGRNRAGLRLFMLLIVATLPAVVVGLTLRTKIKEYLFGPETVCWALVVGGALMIVAEWVWRRRKGARRITDVEGVRLHHALIIGAAQVLAMWPGTSRSMITIVAGLLIGLNMVAAAEFSFLLALPTLGGATLLEGVRDYRGLMDCTGVAGLAVGLIVSCVVAAIAVKAFVKWLTRHGMMPFGVYRILFGAAVYLYFL